MRIPPPIMVFVNPQAAGNIGALARVMSNFGVIQLRLVGVDPSIGRDPNDPFFSLDWALAKRGDGIRESAQWFVDLNAALVDTEMAIGTSGRDVEFDLGYGRPLVLPEVALATVAEAAANAGGELKWALVMGAEDDGLQDHEAALCHQLIRIPTSNMNASMNIAMAAGVLLYHWNLFNREVALGSPAPTAFMGPARQLAARDVETGRADAATHAHKETFVEYVMATLANTDFLKYPDQEAVKARIRRWLQVGQIPLGELLFAFEIVYHLRAWGSGKFEQRDFLKQKP